MSISKSGCSVSITKKDLDCAYKQGFADCAKILNEYKNELQAYKDKEEQGLLYRKVYMIKPSCYKPKDCDGDCDVCPSNGLEVDSEIILFSQYDKEKHYDSASEAEEALARMKGENKEWES